MPVSLSDPLMSLEESRFARLTADEYQAMTESGTLREAPIELLDGILVWKDRRDRGGSITNVGVRHSNCVDWLHRFLDNKCAGHGCHARAQQPVRVSIWNVPEPDVMILRGEPMDYRNRQAQAADALLVIEVADSSLKHDRDDKLKKYASMGIPEYWIVNLLEDQFEVYTSPDADRGTYDNRQVVLPGASAPFTLPDGVSLSVDVSRMLP